MFSIVIPAYNVENEISACLSSIKEQTFENFEVIIAIDGATDKTTHLCKKFAEGDGRFKIIESKHTGYAGAMRNLGLKSATNEYIVFLDADDALEPDALEKLSAFIKPREPLDIVFSRFTECRRDKSGNYLPLNSVYNFDRNNAIFDGSSALEFLVEKRRPLLSYSFANIYRREFLLENKLFQPEDIKLHEDSQWLPRVIFSAKRTSASDFSHYKYVKRSNSITTRISETTLSDISREVEDLITFFGENMDKMSKGVRKFFVCHALNSLFWYFFNPLYDKQLNVEQRKFALNELFSKPEMKRNLRSIFRYATVAKKVALLPAILFSKGLTPPARAFFKFVYFNRK